MSVRSLGADIEDNWPCDTCRVRDVAFCGTLIGKLSPKAVMRGQLLRQFFKTYRAGEDILVRGDDSKFVYILCEGWAFRYFRLPDGRRQILAIILSGDLFSAAAVYEDRSYCSVSVLTAARLCLFDRDQFKKILIDNPAIAEAVARSCIADSRGANERIVVLGRMTAEERIAYMLLDLLKRLMSRGAVANNRFAFPLRQHQLAEMTGLTSVHVSRVMTNFRKRNLIDMSAGFLTILNPVEIARIGSLQGKEALS